VLTDNREQASQLIALARRIVVLTGAGISAESGVPTFRGAGGLWKTYRAEDLATPQAFARDSRLVWEWYGWRREVVARCEPNDAHRALARLALRHDNVTIVTQNVDGLHMIAAQSVAFETSDDERRARPLELHGSLFTTLCTRCEWRRDNDREPINASTLVTLPRCERCGALARPGVVWFGESLDPAALDRAFAEAAAADVCLVIGTSGVVQPAASIALATRDGGGSVIEVNPIETPISDYARISLRARAAAVVPALCASEP
jgi:NAD-dependent deacetylase